MLPPDYREGRSQNLHPPRPNADFKWSSPAVRARSPERPLSLRVFGCLPGAGARGCTEAGVRKASKEESAGSFAPTLVSVYGDLMRGCEALAGFRTGTPGG